jgi:hypothetical protein
MPLILMLSQAAVKSVVMLEGMSQVRSSFSERPAMNDRTVAASLTHRAIGPTVSCLLEKGMTKSRGAKPVVGRIVTKLLRTAGPTRFPSVYNRMSTRRLRTGIEASYLGTKRCKGEAQCCADSRSSATTTCVHTWIVCPSTLSTSRTPSWG